MTDSEAKAREINEAVARKLGWLIDKYSDLRPWYGLPNTPQQSPMVRELPNFCRSIEAAWEIVEADKIKGFSITRCWDTGDWIVNYNLDGAFIIGPEDNSERWHSARADTAPMAICLAFLKLGAK